MDKVKAAKIVLKYKAEMLMVIADDLDETIQKSKYDEYDGEMVREFVDHCLEGTSRLENIIDAAEWTYNSGIGDQVSRIRSRVEIIEGYLRYVEWARRNKK